MKLPEVLAPGGDNLSVKAAIFAGADAVYLGLQNFNARRSAKNISIEDLADLVSLAHQNDTRIYLTLNILLTQKELLSALSLLKEAINCGVDGVIVQDFGLINLIHSNFPDLEIHASTQMTVTEMGKIRLLSSMGVNRVNLSRELSNDEIAIITDECHSIGMETEVFVHGAYCFSFSGQCYMSSFMGGQSGNRGSCFQPCRRSYDIGNKRKFEVLSLQDNNALANAKDLISAGVDSIKIEGRLKDYFYVHETVSGWRNSLDAIALNEQISDKDLSHVFNRNFDNGYLEKSVSISMRSGTPYDRSIIIAGKIKAYSADEKLLTLTPENELPPVPWDFLVINDQKRFVCHGVIDKVKKDKNGESVCSVTIEGKMLFHIEPGFVLGIRPCKIERDALLDILKSFNAKTPAVDITCSGSIGNRLTAVFSIGKINISVSSSQVLQKAENTPLDHEKAKKQFSRLGNTSFKLGSFIWEINEPVFIPVSELNSMRREGVALIEKKYHASENRLLYSKSIQTKSIDSTLPITKKIKQSVILCTQKFYQSNIDQLKNTIDSTGVKDYIFWVEVQDPDTMPVPDDNTKVVPYFNSVIPPDVHKKFLEYLGKLSTNIKNPFISADNPGFGFDTFKNLNIYLGPYANISNGETVNVLSEKLNVAGYVPSIELNKHQLEALLSSAARPGYVYVFGIPRLMYTAQCMLSFINDCPKKYMDSNCWSHCTGTGQFSDESRRFFYINKGTNEYTGIYNDEVIFLYQAFRFLKSKLSGVIIDIRHFETRISENAMINLPSSVIDILHNNKELNKNEFPFSTLSFSKGHYNRGLD